MMIFNLNISISINSFTCCENRKEEKLFLIFLFGGGRIVISRAGPTAIRWKKSKTAKRWRPVGEGTGEEGENAMEDGRGQGRRLTAVGEVNVSDVNGRTDPPLKIVNESATVLSGRRAAGMAGVVFSCPCCLRLKFSPEEIEQHYRSQEIDKKLEEEKQSFRRQVKLLLLGAGESGKSTFLKQMRIIHGVKFEPESVREYQHIIYQNIVKGMKVLVDARDKLGIPWERASNADDGRRLLGHDNGTPLDARLFLHYSPMLNNLWKDSGIRRAFERRREFQLSDSVQYFLDELERISKPDYVPTNKDILHARKATKGISEFTISINNIPFRFVDVGGQRSQRQKWFQCFDSVTSIIFLVSSSEFDQVLVEDRKTNRLEESRNIFDTIVNNLVFRGVSIILFLNKTDLLAEKLKSGETNIRWYFPEFTGDEKKLADVQAFLLEYFRSAKRDPEKRLFYHFTTAVDTENIKVVFNAVKDTILHRNLESLMLQ